MSMFSDIVDEKRAMQMALDISGNHVMCFDLKKDRVYDLHGKAMFGNNVGIDVVLTYIHPEDRQTFQTFIDRLKTGVDKESDCCWRWNYNYTGKGAPDWHYLHGYAIGEYVGGEIVSIIATIKDETEDLLKEQEVEKLSERYRLIFENSIIGLSFYTADGWLLNSNRIMREICNFDSEDGDAYFSNANLFDVFPFNEVLDRHHLNDYWGCSLSVIPERNMRVYLEIGVHPILDQNGKPVYLAISATDVTQERELYLQAKKDEQELKKVNESIQLYESELRYMMKASKMQAWRISLKRDCLEFYQGLSTIIYSLPLNQIQSLFVNQDDDFVRSLSNPAEALSQPLTYIGMMHPLAGQGMTEDQWIQINCIPEYDDQGQLLGSFGVLRNVTDMLQKQDELKRETERANESGQNKSVFLANMTHEIRTPLNAIVGFSDVLPLLSTTEEKQEMVRVIMNNCDMLLRLINDILVASMLDTGGVQIEPAKVDFAQSFDSLCEQLKMRVQEPGVRFLKDNPYEHYLTVVDDGRIQQVITNFLTNAVKYTHEGHILLGWRPETRDGIRGLYIYCEDTGDGISKEMQHKIFERFFKVNDFIQGTGLGLSICKAIVEACHGTIGVQSEGIGHGTTFWVWIPEEMKDEK